MFLLILYGDYPDYVYISEFTFHYVSINTNKCSHHLLDSYIFTFHYVSINTNCVRLLLEDGCDLHSIMFLLILVSAFKDVKKLAEFTFHYVSINTTCISPE